MPTTITAAVSREPGQPLEIENLTLDDLRPDEVRVRMVATGICHTDAVARDQVYPVPLPAVFGHEGAGVVEAIGVAVNNVEVGDHVVLGPAYCGTCRQCRAGSMAYCENLFAEDFGARRRNGTTSLSDADGKQVGSHFFGQSSFSTYADVVQESVIVIDKDAPLELMGPLGCGLQTGAGAVLNELDPEAGSSLAVFGAGAVGSAAIMAAKIAGCTTIIALDIHDSRLQLARELGATHTVNTRDADIVEEIRAITDGDGVNWAVDTTALPFLQTAAAKALSIRGTLGIVGAAKPGTEASFEMGESLTKGWTLKTIVQGSSVPQLFIPRLVRLWKDGLFPFEKLVRTYPFEQINQGFEDSANGTTIKPIVTFDS